MVVVRGDAGATGDGIGHRGITRSTARAQDLEHQRRGGGCAAFLHGRGGAGAIDTGIEHLIVVEHSHRGRGIDDVGSTVLRDVARVGDGHHQRLVWLQCGVALHRDGDQLDHLVGTEGHRIQATQATHQVVGTQARSRAECPLDTGHVSRGTRTGDGIHQTGTASRCSPIDKCLPFGNRWRNSLNREAEIIVVHHTGHRGVHKARVCCGRGHGNAEGLVTLYTTISAHLHGDFNSGLPCSKRHTAAGQATVGSQCVGGLAPDQFKVVGFEHGRVQRPIDHRAFAQHARGIACQGELERRGCAQGAFGHSQRGVHQSQAVVIVGDHGTGQAIACEDERTRVRLRQRDRHGLVPLKRGIARDWNDDLRRRGTGSESQGARGQGTGGQVAGVQVAGQRPVHRTDLRKITGAGHGKADGL